MKENVHIFRLLFLMWEREAWLHCTESIPVFFSSGLSMSCGTSIPQQCFTPVTGHYRRAKNRQSSWMLICVLLLIYLVSSWLT